MAAINASRGKAISFESQQAWLDWIQDSKPAELRAVQTLAVHLNDVDLSTILRAPGSQSTGKPSPSAWQLYQKELARLDRGLTLMPSLLHIRIVPPRPGQSQLLRTMYLSFLKLIPARFPKLLRLELADSNHVLKVVPELNQIALVYCLQPASVATSSTAAPIQPAFRYKTEEGASKTRARNARDD